MARIASDEITLTRLAEPTAVRLYYAKVTSVPPTPPALPSPNPSTTLPSAPWSTTEPAYVGGDTSTVYTTMVTSYGANYHVCGERQLYSAYEAAKAAWNKANGAVTEVRVEFAVSSSNVTPPTTGWTTAKPNKVVGQFIWTQTITKTGTGSSVTYGPALLTGDKGDKGDTGPKGPHGDLGPGVETQQPYYASFSTEWAGEEGASESILKMGGVEVARSTTPGIPPFDGSTQPYPELVEKFLPEGNLSKANPNLISTADLINIQNRTVSGFSGGYWAVKIADEQWVRDTFTGGPYTLSYRIKYNTKVDPSDPRHGLFFLYSVNTAGNMVLAEITSAQYNSAKIGEWLSVSNTTTPTEANYSDKRLLFYTARTHPTVTPGANANATIDSLKLERGSKATAWIPAVGEEHTYWSPQPPPYDENSVLYETWLITYDDGRYIYTPPTIQYPGPQGAKGDTGAQGISFKSLAVYYMLLDRDELAPLTPTKMDPTVDAPGWTMVEPEWAENKNMWRTMRVVTSNNMFTWTPVSKVSTYQAADTAMGEAATARYYANMSLENVTVSATDPSTDEYGHYAGRIWMSVNDADEITNVFISDAGTWKIFSILGGLIVVPGADGKPAFFADQNGVEVSDLVAGAILATEMVAGKFQTLEADITDALDWKDGFPADSPEIMKRVRITADGIVISNKQGTTAKTSMSLTSTELKLRADNTDIISLNAPLRETQTPRQYVSESLTLSQYQVQSPNGAPNVLSFIHVGPRS